MTTVLDLWARIIACKLDDIPLNVSQIVISDMKFFRNYGGTHLLFPYLITKLCRRAGVVEYPRDTWVSPETSIYPLKIWVEGALGKYKKKKIDLGKSTCEDPKSYRPDRADLFEEIGIDLNFIREFVWGLPKGSGEPFTTHHSYVAQSDYEKYLKDQQMHGATISRLEKAYSSLAEFHRKISGTYMRR